MATDGRNHKMINYNDFGDRILTFDFGINHSSTTKDDDHSWGYVTGISQTDYVIT